MNEQPLRNWIGYDEERAILLDVMSYPDDKFTHIPGATYIEIFPPLHPDAIKIERDSSGNVIIVQDDEQYERLYSSQLSFTRYTRNLKLTESDFTQNKDYINRISDEMYQKWVEYRQQLRDITENLTNPFEVTWPIRPDKVVETSNTETT